MMCAESCRQRRSRGLTLMEVSVSIAVVTVIILAAIGTRYLAVKQAVRADAYNTAGRIGLLLLEGWRSSGEPNAYDALAKLGTQFTSPDLMESVASGGPATPSGFITLVRPGSTNPYYHFVLDRRHYYVTLAYKNATTTAPATLHVTVGFRQNYQVGSLSAEDNYVRLTTYD